MLRGFIIKMLFLFFIGFLCFVVLYKNLIQGFENESKVGVFFEYGTPLNTLLLTLKEKEVIRYQWPMKLYLKIHGQSNDLQSGDFIIPRGMPIPELIILLSHSKPKEIAVRIIEGNRSEEIDDLLTNKGLIKKGEFNDCLKTCSFKNIYFLPEGNKEGFLFPDTYFVSTTDFRVQNFISRMFQNFNKQFLTKENKVKIESQAATLKEVTIMASIIEMEESNTVNMPFIGGILWKRINEGIPMGADATTRYYEKNKTGILTRSDFEKNNPYNTRRKRGLPPTAIGNPGIKALNAALNPKKSKYYYYLHDPSGNIHYAQTNNEHNQNKRKYLQ
jgi:UPF0755 protein